MKKILHFVVLFLAISTFTAKSQISITNISSPYSQDFNTLANSGASASAVPAGWGYFESGANADLNYGIDAGGGGTANTYSYGTTSASDRALGTLRSANLQSVLGVNFTNNSGVTITSLTVTYTGEEWRLGATSRADSLQFQYSTNATSLSTGTWVDQNELDFTTPVITGSLGGHDGNAAANRTLITFTITGLNIADGGSFWLKWVDTDATGADDGLAIDDFSVSYNSSSTPICTEPASQPSALLLTPSPTTVSGSFTQPVPNADQYLVVRSTASSLSALPLDGTNYILGQSIGGGTVISIGTAVSFVDAALTANTQYYYYVFALNSESCLSGPNYATISPLTNNTTTLSLAGCVAPTASATALSLVPSNTTVAGSFTVAASANRYLIVRSTASSLSASPANGVTYTVGQALGGGVVVDYTTTNSFLAIGLTAGTKYYFYVFAANGDCSGEPFYRTTALTGNTTTTNTSTGIPAGYYDAANGLTCAALKTALKNIISANTVQSSYTPGVWNAIKSIDIHRNDANTADIIWDIYTDNPTGAETYTFTAGTDQCGTYSAEGGCYNREHSFPQEWFGNGTYPMYSDLHHIFPVDGWINGKHDSNPYGEVSNPTFTSISNGSKLGPNTTGCFNGTVFEPINAYKGDIARAQLYMITRYQDNMVAWQNNGQADNVLNGTTYPSLDDWYIQLLLKWHHLDPVSQKEIDRNNGIYAIQKNRNPFIDVPDFADQMFSCMTYQCKIVPVKLVSVTAMKVNTGIVVNWNVAEQTNVKQYDVQRSTDGIHFTKIGEVAAQNISAYSFADNALPASSMVYYMLTTIDLNGKTNNSRIVTVRVSNTSAIALYPNPSVNNITIKLQQNLKANSILMITDVVGRIVLQKNISAAQNVIPLSVAGLANGKYFVTIKNDTELIRESFIKIR